MSLNFISLDKSTRPLLPSGNTPHGIETADSSVVRRIKREGLMGLGETYAQGLWFTDLRLDELMYGVFTNPQPPVSPLIWAKWFLALTEQRLLNRNSSRRAFNIGIQHYDLGNDLFRIMLDESMTYTSGYWATASNLRQAQVDKLDLLCQKLDLRKGMHVLDIGCGWGNFAQHAAERYGVRVTGITVSRQQAGVAAHRCDGLPVEIRLQDYREISGHFDRIVSIEMIEAVGRKNIGTFYRVVDRCLKDDGLFALQAITGDTFSRTSDRRLDQYMLWLVKYIFPDGYLPRQSELAGCGGTTMRIEDWHAFDLDYDRTLLAWAENFNAGWDQVKDRYGEEFRRRWNFYLYSCAAAFRAGLVRVSQIVYSKRNRRHSPTSEISCAR